MQGPLSFQPWTGTSQISGGVRLKWDEERHVLSHPEIIPQSNIEKSLPLTVPSQKVGDRWLRNVHHCVGVESAPTQLRASAELRHLPPRHPSLGARGRGLL